MFNEQKWSNINRGKVSKIISILILIYKVLKMALKRIRKELADYELKPK